MPVCKDAQAAHGWRSGSKDRSRHPLPAPTQRIGGHALSLAAAAAAKGSGPPGVGCGLPRARRHALIRRTPRALT